MALTLKTAPTSEPVTLAEAKEQTRVTHSDEDDYITNLIIAARRYGEEARTSRAFCSQTWELRLDEFPADNGAIEPPRPPLRTVSSIAYLDADGTSATLTADTDYRTDIYSEPGRITPAYGKTWPTTYPVTNAVTVTYGAGYGTLSAVPEEIRQAVLFTVAHWYENREPGFIGGTYSPVPVTLDALWAVHSMKECG